MPLLRPAGCDYVTSVNAAAPEEQIMAMRRCAILASLLLAMLALGACSSAPYGPPDCDMPDTPCPNLNS
jgi:hypothetical protein